MPPFRLIATDLDGTLIGPDLDVGARVRAALGRARSQGVRVVIATGRMFRSALPYARELELTDPLITYQGAWIRDPVSLDTVWHNLLPPSAALEAIDLVQRLGIHLNLYRDDSLLVERLTPECDSYCRQARVQASVVPDLAAHHAAVTKLVAVAAAEVLDQHQAQLAGALGERLYVVRSAPRYLEFAAPGTSKAVALAEVARLLDIPLAQTVAFGDADNDAAMIALAGLGVSVGNASPAAREAANRHVERIGEGVADVLDELLDA